MREKFILILMNMFKDGGATSPEEYILKLDEPRRAEANKIYKFIKETLPDLKPFMLSGMIGFGRYHYKGKSTEGEWMVIALSSRKDYISIYVCAYDGKKYIAEDYKDRLKASIGKSCVRFKKVEDIDWDVLRELIKNGVQMMKDQGYTVS